MNQIEFNVQGSSPEPYNVIFRKDGNNLTALCDCPAGMNRLYCKHRFNILNGIADGIVSENAEQVNIVEGWLSGTDVDEAMHEVKIAEKNLDDAKKHLAKLKKKLARTMHD